LVICWGYHRRVCSISSEAVFKIFKIKKKNGALVDFVPKDTAGLINRSRL